MVANLDDGYRAVVKRFSLGYWVGLPCTVLMLWFGFAYDLAALSLTLVCLWIVLYPFWAMAYAPTQRGAMMRGWGIAQSTMFALLHVAVGGAVWLYMYACVALMWFACPLL